MHAHAYAPPRPPFSSLGAHPHHDFRVDQHMTEVDACEPPAAPEGRRHWRRPIYIAVATTCVCGAIGALRQSSHGQDLALRAVAFDDDHSTIGNWSASHNMTSEREGLLRADRCARAHLRAHGTMRPRRPRRRRVQTVQTHLHLAQRIWRCEVPAGLPGFGFTGQLHVPHRSRPSLRRATAVGIA